MKTTYISRTYIYDKPIYFYNELYILSQFGKCFIKFKDILRETLNKNIELDFKGIYFSASEEVVFRLSKFKISNKIIIDNSPGNQITIYFVLKE